MSEIPQKLAVENLKEHLVSLDLNGASTYSIPRWTSMADPERLKFLRNLVMQRGRDPRIASLCIDIFKKAGVKPRDFKGQLSALLKWVQTNVYFCPEAAERIQDPIFTMTQGFGDCDDSTVLLATLAESCRMTWRFVIAGIQGGKKVRGPDGKITRVGGKKIRFVEGSKYPSDCEWSHIYLLVGEAFTPKNLFFCETTIVGVPIGWDIIDGSKAYLPEMDNSLKGPPRIVPAAPAPTGFRPKPLPPVDRRSPAYALAFTPSEASAQLPVQAQLPTPAAPAAQIAQQNFGSPRFLPSNSEYGMSPIGAAVGMSIGEDVNEQLDDDDSALSDPDKKKKTPWIDFEKMVPGILTGVSIAILTQLSLDWLRPKVKEWTTGPSKQESQRRSAKHRREREPEPEPDLDLE